MHVTRRADGTGRASSTSTRACACSRARRRGAEAEQVIVANPDQVVFVFACADPEPNFRMLDRLLVVAERERIPAQMCANKIDLAGRTRRANEFDVYRASGLSGASTSPP